MIVPWKPALVRHEFDAAIIARASSANATSSSVRVFHHVLRQKLIALFLMPPLALLILICAGSLLLGWRPAQDVCWPGSGPALALLVTTPRWRRPRRPRKTSRVLQPAQLADAGRFVILGGGARTNAPEFGGQTVNRLTLERRYGARPARQSACWCW